MDVQTVFPRDGGARGAHIREENIECGLRRPRTSFAVPRVYHYDDDNDSDNNDVNDINGGSDNTWIFIRSVTTHEYNYMYVALFLG